MSSLEELSKNKIALAGGKLAAVAVAMLASYLGARFDASDKAGVATDKAASGYTELSDTMKRLEQSAVMEEMHHREAIAYLTGRLEALERTGVKKTLKKLVPPPSAPPLVQQLKQQVVGPEQEKQVLQTATLPDSLQGAYEKHTTK